MRGQQGSKSNICKQGVCVNVAGISVEVGAHYPGRSVTWSEHGLPASGGVAKRWQKSAEGIVAGVDPREGLNMTKPMDTKNG